MGAYPVGAGKVEGGWCKPQVHATLSLLADATVAQLPINLMSRNPRSTSQLGDIKLPGLIPIPAGQKQSRHPGGLPIVPDTPPTRKLTAAIRLQHSFANPPESLYALVVYRSNLNLADGIYQTPRRASGSSWPFIIS